MKILIIILTAIFTMSCGVNKNMTTLNPLNMSSYYDTDTEYRDWGSSNSPDNSMMRAEATSEALNRISLKVNSDVKNIFEEYVQQHNISDSVEVNKIMEYYEIIKSDNSLNGWTVIEEAMVDGVYYIAIGISKQNTITKYTKDINDIKIDRNNFINRTK